ncbi:MAG: restriction endonuclease subunit S [Nitrosomonadales bacterium]
MQSQLEQIEKDSGIEWKEYRIDDLFEIGTGSLIDIKSAKNGKVPRISVQTTDNGILGYYEEPIENARYFENFLSVNFFGVSYYHPYRASVEMKVHTLMLKSRDFTQSIGVFFATILNIRFKERYSYGNQLSSSKLKEDGIKIHVPTVTKNGKTEISFDFIEKFIATLNAERIATLQAHLTVTGLNNCTLTDNEQAALDVLDTVAWGTFKIEDVLVWQKNISELNPLHLDSLTVSEEKKYPFYGQSTTNNGIIEYRHLKDEVLNNKSGKPTILIHSNNQNVVYLDTPFYLKDGHGATTVLQSKYLNKITAQFLMGSIKKVISQKYTYNSKATKIELKSTEINLPVKTDGTPNYDYMTLVISAMQKVVIKNVVDYLDTRIEKTVKILQ